jgi:hypothetical protein
MITLHTLPRYALFFIFSISFSILSAQLNVSPTASVTDGGTYPELDGARGITTVVIGEKTYALVAAFSDDGVQIIDISNPASPSAVASVTDGTTYPALNGARGITTVVIGEKTYALVAAFSDDGVQIMELVDPSFSAEEILANTVLLYPNPAKSQLKYAYPTHAQYTIYSLTGQVLGQAQQDEAVHTIDIAHLSRGTCLLKTTNGTDEKHFHFIKE